MIASKNGIDSMLNGNFFTQADAIAEQALLAQGTHDEGNAQCVYLRYAGRFLHSDALGWLAHNKTHWTSDGAEAMLDRAIVDTLNSRIEAALGSGKADQHSDLIKRCIPTSGRVQGAKYLFSSLVYAHHTAFDTNPDALNCPNGVVNLRTGALSDHTTSDRFTHCTQVEYKPLADQSVWRNWLVETVGPEIADWLQIAVGYTATGHTREEILFYLFGPPRAGKGLFTETLISVLGAPLAKEVNFSTFTAQRTGDSQSFDLAPLKPCRLVAASESNAYERFNEAKVKALTGGNEIYCAFKHRDHFNYRPQFKIWLSSNQPVNADPDDDAVWGRLRVIEFAKSHLGQEDKSLKEKMKAPDVLEGVLAWIVAGAMRWYTLGSKGLPELAASAAVKTAHRSELDNIAGWIDECCERADTFTPYSALYMSYETWCKSNGVEAKKQKGFSQALSKKGLTHKSVKLNGKLFKGFTGVRII